MEKTAELRKALRQKEEELSLLRTIGETINSTLDLTEILKQIVEVVVHVTRADACLLYLLEPRTAELVLQASKNPHPRLIGRIKLELGEGITGWVAKEKKPVAIAKDAMNDPRFKFFQNLPEDRYQAVLSVPIISRDEVIGVINVQHKRVHRHTPGEITVVSTIAHQVRGAIENARLYQEARKKALQIDTLSQVSRTIISNRYLAEILQLIVTVTAEMMNSKICSIMLVNREKPLLEIVATQSLSEAYRKKSPIKVGESISGRVVVEKKPMAALDVTQDPHFTWKDLAKKEGLVSLLSVPMMVKDRVIGVINSYTSYEYKFSEEEIKIIQAVANQAAIAIENTTLMEKSVEMQEALETRKIIERAKGMLMKEHKVSEEEAFRMIQRQSMNTRRTMREIAEALIVASEITA